ncbi:MAG: hypothetical protein WAL71_11105 [Terriglobales bacterium]|jgi:hypothetical protein
MDESALKTLLDNLDASRSSLHAWLHFWTFLVVLGVALEVVFVVKEYIDQSHDFRRGILHPPEKPSTMLFILGLLGAGLVAIGVAGELYIDVQAGRVETEIRKANELRVALLSKEAGDAKASAEGAANAAANAKGQSEKAVSSASNAMTLAKGAGQEADSFARDIVSAKRQAADAESHLADAVERTARLEQLLSWRSVTREQSKAINDFLTPLFFTSRSRFRGVKIKFEYSANDLEASEYADELAKTLHDAFNVFGVEIGKPEGVVSVSFGPPEVGVTMRVRRADDPLAPTLQQALKAAGIDAQGQIRSDVPEMTVVLYVGVKPKPSALKE